MIDNAVPDIVRSAQDTPTSGALPRDLVQAAARRLGLACLVWAGLWGLALALNNLVSPILSPGVPLDDAWPWPGNPVALAVIVTSLALFAYTRRVGANPWLLLDLGLLYEVALAFGIGLVNQWTPNTAGLSWICVLVLIHPMIVPHTRPRTLLAALAAASMDPLGIVITGARGVPIPSLPVVIWTYLPNYICAVLAILPSHVIARLGRDVKQARQLGSYQLGELLGKGGMGEVYAATHRMLRRRAAIKLIRREALQASQLESSSTVVLRFQREAEAAAQLRSPHSVVLYDFGVTERGQLYTVMEFLHGIDLEELIKRFGPLPPARVIHLVQQACESLAEAHALGLVHRDVKPANIYTCWVGLEADFVKVLDFGLVKGDLGGGRGHTMLTAPEITTGTPAYMSPEQACGEEVDGRSDIYALGCVAYWLLTGELVFRSQTPMQMMLAHVHDAPVPPSARSPHAVSAALDEVVLACLAKEPAGRPQTAGELATRLAACAVGDAWGREEAAAWWREHLPERAGPHR
jgi:tRNA A-37 threonylcarbamoyl transferase component Bud32